MMRNMIDTPDGRTQVFVIIGDPVTQVQAPQLMNAVFAKAGSNSLMVPMQVSSDDAPALIRALKSAGNVGGFLATIPHKFELLSHANHIGAVAEAAGCANALRRNADGSWSTENFDGIGFVTGMKNVGHAIGGKTVAVYGAGGAGSSIAAALLDAGAEQVRISDVSQPRCEQLCARLERHWPGRAIAVAAGRHLEVDIVINATPMGLGEGDPLPFTLEGLNPNAVVAEIIMKPAETRLLREARARGFKTQAGFAMLAPQIDLYRQFFRIPDTDAAGNSSEAVSSGGFQP